MYNSVLDKVIILKTNLDFLINIDIDSKGTTPSKLIINQTTINILNQ